MIRANAFAMLSVEQVKVDYGETVDVQFFERKG